MTVAGLSPILWAISPLIVWAAHFLGAYGGHATVCALGLENRMLLGQPLVPTMLILGTALALLLVALLGQRAGYRLRYGGEDEYSAKARRSTDWLTLSTSLLAALAIAWEAVPILILPSCA